MGFMGNALDEVSEVSHEVLPLDSSPELSSRSEGIFRDGRFLEIESVRVCVTLFLSNPDKLKKNG